MGTPTDRLRWFHLYFHMQHPHRGFPPDRQQASDRSTQAKSPRWQLEPGFFVAGVRQCCPGSLLRSLKVGDQLELAPESSGEQELDLRVDAQNHSISGRAVRVEFGLFQVGYAPAPASRLLHRLLRQGIGISAQVGKLDLTAPLDRALWIDACLLE